ncbi:hypothetical protein FRB94_009446 [Tulasnella sp. JGI-2019a]|nr:hypothetical protein FRB94_009446 [Tulasnella sp. JGI-2019a]
MSQVDQSEAARQTSAPGPRFDVQEGEGASGSKRSRSRDSRISASALVRDAKRFLAWLLGTNIQRTPPNECPKDARAKAEASRRLPSELGNAGSSLYQLVPSTLATMQQMLIMEVKALQYPSTEPLSLNSPPTPLPNTSDVASLKTPVGNESLEAVPVGGESSALAVDTHLTDVLPCILYAAWRLRRLMTFDQEGDPSKEATWRTPVDTLLDVVLSNNAANERCNLKMEVPISLPKSTAEDINVGDAIMDTGYFSYHIDIFQTAAYSKGGGMALLEKISVMPTPDTQRILILQLPCEYKQYFGEFQHGQLMYDLCAAQNQLKILGLTDETIYGIGCIKGVVDIKWSRWEHDHIKIGHVTTFDLRIPSQGVMFYRFLTLVQQDIIKRITTLESVTADQLRISGVEVTWKMDRMPPPGPSDSKRSRLDPHVGGTGGNRQYDAMDWSDSEEPEEEVEDDVDVVEVEERTRSWRDRLGDPLKNITKTPLMELPDQNGLAYIK